MANPSHVITPSPLSRNSKRLSKSWYSNLMPHMSHATSGKHPPRVWHQNIQTQQPRKEILCFEWSPPWHVKQTALTSPSLCICQVRVVIRFYVSLISSSSSSLLPPLPPPPHLLLYCDHMRPVFAAGPHVRLLSTSHTDCRKSSGTLSDILCISPDILSDILSDISSDVLSGISPDILSDISSDILSDRSSDSLSDISSDILSDIDSDILFAISSNILSDILSGISSDIVSDISPDILFDILSDISPEILSDILSGIFSDILSTHWRPAANTGRKWSWLRSASEHWAQMIAVEVR